MSIFQMMISPSVPLSSRNFISSNPFFPTPKFSSFCGTIIIRMGGGPRTFPGGVSKWQWKRMQAKKSKQLLKARLARERQIYEMRKRAELKSALSELERPWEVVEKAPTLFSVKADEQLKVLADRFQKPGGFDMWSERDGPELFKNGEGFETARFFPKGVVHSVKPYGKIGKSEGLGDVDWGSVLNGGGGESNLGEKMAKRLDKMVIDESSDKRFRNNEFRKRRDRRSRNSSGSEEMSSREVVVDEGNGRRNHGRLRNSSGSEEMSSREVVVDEGNRRRNHGRIRNSSGSEEMSSREVAVDEGNWRRNYGRSRNSSGSEEMGSREVVDERNGRRNHRRIRNTTGSEEMSLREVGVDEGNGRKNFGQVYNKRDYRMQNSSQKLKEPTKADVCELRLERNGRYEFRPRELR